MPSFAFLIVHYKNPADTLDCIESILSMKGRCSCRVYLYLNSLFPKIPEQISSKIEILGNGENKGFACANNILIKKALSGGADYLILVNNDAVLDHNFQAVTEKFIQKEEFKGLLSPKIYFYPGREYRKNYQKKERGMVLWYAGGIIDRKNAYAFHRGVDKIDKREYDRIEKTDFATGCVMLISASVIHRIGYLNEKFFMYYEDVDYSLRAKQAGFEVLYFPNVFAHHKNAASSGNPGSLIHEYYQTRNRIYIAMGYFSLRTKKAVLVESLKFLFKGGIRSRAVRDYLLGRWGKRL